MNSLCLVVRKAPYGHLFAGEGIRHLIGAAAAGMEVLAVLVDDGVYVAKRGQDPGGTGWPSLSAALQQAVHQDGGAAPGCVRVYVHTSSAQARGLNRPDLVPGVEPIDDDRLTEIVAGAECLLAF